jgi:hypothetical protein
MTGGLRRRTLEVTLSEESRKMNFVDVHLTPELLEESRRELERERERRRRIQEARAARRPERPSRFEILKTLIRRAPQHNSRRPIVEGC